jgi:hypothetical protein
MDSALRWYSQFLLSTQKHTLKVLGKTMPSRQARWHSGSHGLCMLSKGLAPVYITTNIDIECCRSTWWIKWHTTQQFLGSDHFSDTDSVHAAQLRFYTDPLWDGVSCGPLNTCCSFNNPPWFYKQLPQPTTEEGMFGLHCWERSNIHLNIYI